MLLIYGNIVAKHGYVANDACNKVHLAALIAIVQRFDMRGAMQCIVKHKNVNFYLLGKQSENSRSIAMYRLKHVTRRHLSNENDGKPTYWDDTTSNSEIQDFEIAPAEVPESIMNCVLMKQKWDREELHDKNSRYVSHVISNSVLSTL